MTFARLKYQPSFGLASELTVCKAGKNDAVMELVQFGYDRNAKSIKAIRLSNVELRRFLAELCKNLQKERFESLWQPGLVQLDGAKYDIEVNSGLVTFHVSVLGPEDERQNQGSPLLTWMTAQKLRFR